MKSNILKNVIQAFRINIVSFIQVGMMWSTIIYLLALFAFWYAFEDYGFLAIDENQCTHLFNCVLSSFLDIETDRTIEPSFRNEYGLTKYMIRSLWNVAFNVTNKNIIKNIFAALLIGTFAELRTNNLETTEDDNNFCFICNLDRATLDKRMGFDYHCEKEHYIWHYFNFIFVLSLKTKAQFNGIETYIMEKVKQPPIAIVLIILFVFQVDAGEHAWIPQFRGRSINNIEEVDFKSHAFHKLSLIEEKCRKSRQLVVQRIALKNA